MQHCPERLNLIALSFLILLPLLGILLNNTYIPSHSLIKLLLCDDLGVTCPSTLKKVTQTKLINLEIEE